MWSCILRHSCRSTMVSMSTSAACSAVQPATPTNTTACRSAAIHTDQAAVIVHAPVVKSPEDRRLYRALTLANKMQVLLISDPHTDKAAASMTVQVGHMCDPDDTAGLAHFCEHMLFMGSAKYPHENEYSSFLQQHGGASNAYTAHDHTTYYFDVVPQHFADAVDRFAQFFISPLFDADCVDREMCAVHSEHEKNISVDSWRVMQVERCTYSSDHPLSKFGTGCRDTLNHTDVRDRLIRFHQRWYCPQLMNLVMLGRQSLEQLQLLAVETFSAVASQQQQEAPTWQTHPLSPQQLGRQVSVEPVKDVRQLKLEFAVPDLRQLYRTQPQQYVAHLLGHEAAGTVYSQLRRLGWASELEAGRGVAARGFQTFCVVVKLTEQGQRHADHVALLVFQYLELMRRAGPQRWLFDECRRLQEMWFRFKDVERPINYVQTLSSQASLYPVEHMLCGPYTMDEYNESAINSLLECLTVDNMRVVRVGNLWSDQCDHTEPWYGVRYGVQPLAASTLQQWRQPPSPPVNDQAQSLLHLPPRNQFIAEDFSLVEPDHLEQCCQVPDEDITNKDDEQEEEEASQLAAAVELGEAVDCTRTEPRLLINSTGVRLWFKQNSVFARPKAIVSMLLYNQLIYSRPQTYNAAHLLVALLNDWLNEHTYAASVAGLQHTVHASRSGLLVYVAGFSDKLPTLLRCIVDAMRSFAAAPSSAVDDPFDARRFAVLRETYVRQLQNAAAAQPVRLSAERMFRVLDEALWEKAQLLACVDDLTEAAVRQLAGRLLQPDYIEALMEGNLTPAVCVDMLTAVQQRLIMPSTSDAHQSSLLLPEPFRLDGELQLPAGGSYVARRSTSVHPSNCVIVYLQCVPAQCSGGDSDSETWENARLLLNLLVQILQEPCFHQLRTREQLGYTVLCYCRHSASCQGLRVCVQSERSAEYVDSRIEAFLRAQLAQLTVMSGGELARHKRALRAHLLERPRGLHEAFQADWRELIDGAYCFNRARRQAARLRDVTHAQLVHFYRKYVCPPCGDEEEGEREGTEGGRRRRLAVYTVSDQKRQDDSEKDGEDAESREQMSAAIEIDNIDDFKQRCGFLPRLAPFLQIPTPAQHQQHQHQQQHDLTVAKL